MRLENVFPRNEDGTLKTKQPCQDPHNQGCRWPNWHICLDRRESEHTKVYLPRRGGGLSDSHKMAISEAQIERHARLRLENSARDRRIVDYYINDLLGMSNIAKIMGIAQSTVNKVLNRAQADGVLKVRPKNHTLSRPGR